VLQPPTDRRRAAVGAREPDAGRKVDPVGRNQRPARELTHLDRGLERLAGKPAFNRFDGVDDVPIGRSG
jgi:hypothetical protein